MIQTGQFDYAWNTLVDKDVRERLEQQGRKGRFHFIPAAVVMQMQLNRTDPWTEVDGECSSLKVPHPFFECVPLIYPTPPASVQSRAQPRARRAA